MGKTDSTPLERSLSLQKQEEVRYLFFKEKYTKELLTADIPQEEREWLVEGIDAVAREYSVSDYVKLKFEGVLTPTDRYLWTSLFKYVHDYSITLQDFINILESYCMSLPVNLEKENVYNELPKHRWVKIQDDKGKSMYGPYEELSSDLDFSLIRYLHVQEGIFQELLHFFDKEPFNNNIVGLGAGLRDNLIITNHSFFHFFSKTYLQTKGEIPKEVRTYCNPDGVTVYHSDVFMSFIQRATFYGLNWKENSPFNTKYLQDGLYSTVKIMQGYCAFVSLCASLLIASLSDAKYRDSLFDMMFFFLLNFHNAYIFRIEMPCTPLDEKLRIEERGSKDHTTRMKIYLYDAKRDPYVVRVDMPHKGDGDENKLHFNVETLDGESRLNHRVIDCHDSNPTDLLNVMIDNMSRMTPTIFDTKDSYKEEDKRMLEIMKGFNAYDDMCMAYFFDEDNQKAIEEYNRWIGCDCKTVEEGIQDGFLYFLTM